MLEISLSGVAAFAALVCYVIVKDEIASQRNQQTKAPKTAQPVLSPSGKTKSRKAPRKTQAKRNVSENSKKVDFSDPINPIANAIFDYLKTNGPVSLKKLGQVLDKDLETIKLASEKLVADQSATMTKKGGYPGLTPVKLK